eukprot:snap_masked-scaffold_26-processed-gene-0.12-mRNA-1 protein AED:1.00 eAED:1.00 QI:0/0/0/0/1/1/2/0/182
MRVLQLNIFLIYLINLVNSLGSPIPIEGESLVQSLISYSQVGNCEYEQDDATECQEPFYAAWREAIDQYPEESQEIWEAAFTDFTSETITLTEYVEIRRELFGARGLCTTNVTNTLPLTILCIVQTCIYCDDTDWIVGIALRQAFFQAMVGCEFTVDLCQNSTQNETSASSRSNSTGKTFHR